MKVATLISADLSIRYNTAKQRCDADTLASMLTHRFDVLASFARAVSAVSRDALHRIASGDHPPSAHDALLRNPLRHWLWGSADALREHERRALEDALPASTVLRTVYALRQALTQLWRRSDASTAQLTLQLEHWCQRAETSGIAALHDFSQTLGSYESVAARP